MNNSQSRKTPEPGDLEILPLPYALGAEIRCGDLREIGDAATKAIHNTYLDHLVLLFRGQTLSDPDLLAFARRFGELDLPTKPEYQAAGVRLRDANMPHINIISNVIENGVAIGGLGDGEARWHSDQSFNEVPYAATFLYALEVPPVGGNTGFINMYLALESLPAATRQRINGLSIKNDTTYNSAGFLRRGCKPVDDVRLCPGPSHPIVRRHPDSGHDALYLGRRRNAYINGLTVEESEALLDELWAHAEKPEFQWHHKWRVGDLLMWDNRCTMHHRDAFDPASRRIMHKTQTVGTRPFEVSGGTPRHSRASARPVV